MSVEPSQKAFRAPLTRRARQGPARERATKRGEICSYKLGETPGLYGLQTARTRGLFTPQSGRNTSHAELGRTPGNVDNATTQKVRTLGPQGKTANRPIL